MRAEPSNKSAITGFHWVLEQKIYRDFFLRLFYVLCVVSLMLLLIPIFSFVRFVVDRVAKLVLFVSVAEADDSPAPTLRRSLLLPLLPPPLTLGKSS